MSLAKCFKDGCTNNVSGKCECEGVVWFCKKHFFTHAKRPNSKGHQCIKLYFKPAEEIKQPLINKLRKLIKDIKLFRASEIINANEIIKNFNTFFVKYMNQITDFEAICNKMIKTLQSEEKILDSAREDDIESVLKLSATDIQNMADWNISEWYLDYEEMKATINNTFKTAFNPFRTFCLNELSFFRPDTKDFTTINLNTFQISSSVSLPIQESINSCTTNCRLPGKSYFYFCNSNSSTGYTFTIDRNKNVKQLQNSKVNAYLDAIFYNNFIYLIGGKVKLAERYDIKRNIWESLAPIDQNLNFIYSCSVLHEDLILITGYYIEKIIIYSITQNSYQEVHNLVLNVNFMKHMLKGNSRIYVFENSRRTFESAENNIYSWTQIGNNSMGNNWYTPSNAAVYYKGYLYFVIYPSELWKFDLSSKQTIKVRIFNIRILISIVLILS